MNTRFRPLATRTATAIGALSAVLLAGCQSTPMDTAGASGAGSSTASGPAVTANLGSASAGKPAQTLRVCGVGQAQTAAASTNPGGTSEAAPAPGQNRIIVNGRDLTAQAEALLPLAAALANAVSRKLEQSAGAPIGGGLGSTRPGSAGGAARPAAPVATGMEPCLMLTLPPEPGKATQDDVIVVRFIPAADGTPIDPQTLSVVGRRFGIERDITDSIRRRAKIDASGMELPLREVPIGRGLVTVSLRDQKQREVRFTQEMEIRSASARASDQG